MKKYFCVFSFAIACALASIPAFAMDYSSRKFNNGVEANYPVGSVIVNADCVFEDGKFIMKSLPSNLPELFTIRFTAPEDFTQGNTIVINGTEMPLRVPSMINASSAIFRAGAVFHIDIDMDRQVAFAWGNQGGSGAGSMPDLSYDEQFAGFHSFDGKKVYMKSLIGPQMTETTQRTTLEKAHDIANIKDFVRAEMTIPREDSTLFSNFTSEWYATSGTIISYASLNARKEVIEIIYKGKFYSTPIITLYYTCTDR